MLKKTADHWGENYFSQTWERQEWQAHPQTQARQYAIQGEQMRDVWFFNKYLGGVPAKRGIGIGVGRADTEMCLLRSGAVEHYDLYDVSPIGLDYAKSCAVREGFGDRVTTHCMPVTEADLPPDTYDVATFVASLHHMQPLGETLETVNWALKPDGMIWCANEYIGPDRFAYPKEHADIARAFFREIPKPLRNKWLTELELPDPLEVARVDPTEAPISSQIEPTMRRMFPRFEATSLYGGFAFIIYWGLNHDALYETPEGNELVRYIMAMDKSLGDAGVLPNYFAHLVAWKTTKWHSRARRLGIDPQGELYARVRRLKLMIAG